MSDITEKITEEYGKGSETDRTATDMRQKDRAFLLEL